jgi:hypothetical protein
MGKLGRMSNPNAKVSAQKVPGSKGVGSTKSQKISGAQKKPSGRVGGGNAKATVSPKKMKGC